jgi:hypothetical protein
MPSLGKIGDIARAALVLTHFEYGGLFKTNPNQDRQLAYQQVRPLSKITSTGVLNKPHGYIT